MLTVFLIGMLTAVAAQLATVSATESLSAARRSRTLQHELSVDSVLAWLAEATGTSQPGIESELDRTERLLRSFEIGACFVRVEIQDDGAKFNPSLFPGEESRTLVEKKLRGIMKKTQLPPVTLGLLPIPTKASTHRRKFDSPQASRYLWFDQLCAFKGPHEQFCWPTADLGAAWREPVWSDRLTFFGDGRVDVRRAPAEVLEVLLEDLDTDLVRDLLSARSASKNPDVVQRALASLSQSARSQATRRLDYDAHRYALTIHTSIGADTRRWYVVVSSENGKFIVHHRSPITW